MAHTNARQGGNQAYNAGSYHSRSLSQPAHFGNHGLPPLSPYPSMESALTSPNSNLRGLSMEDIDVGSRHCATAPPSLKENPFRTNSGLPPRRGHRRANSDVALGPLMTVQSPPQFVSMISEENVGMVDVRMDSRNNKFIGQKRQELVSEGYVDGMSDMKSEGEVVDELIDSLMNVDALNFSAIDGRDMDSMSSGSKFSCGDGSNSESDTASRHCVSSVDGIKSKAAEDIATPFRLSRSLSADSGIENFHCADLSPNQQTPSSNLADQFSPCNSYNESGAKINFDIGSSGFSEAELQKIMADEKLAGIAISDPKRAKRIVANRMSAARSKERKLRYIAELEGKVHTLMTEISTLTTQVVTAQNEHTKLVNEKKELIFRLQAMEQQARLRDDLHDTLLAEAQRLRLAAMELQGEGRSSDGATQQAHIRHHFFPGQQQQPDEMQQVPDATSEASTTPPAPASA